MRNTCKGLCGLSLLAGLAFLTSAADKTWTGQVSDSSCGESHAKMMAGDKSLKTDRDCTLACIKAGGKYVFISDEKVYNIANQDLALLETHAGHTVRLAGEMKGDTITVSNITMPVKKQSGARRDN